MQLFTRRLCLYEIVKLVLQSMPVAMMSECGEDAFVGVRLEDEEDIASGTVCTWLTSSELRLDYQRRSE